MRVAYVIPGVGGGGGAERSLASMVPYLTQHLELDVVTYTERDHLQPQLEASGAQVSVLKARGARELLQVARRHFVRTEPDLVHTTLLDADILGRVVAASTRTPVVTSLVNVNHGRASLTGTTTQVAKQSAVWGANIATARAVVRFHALTEHVAATMSRRLLIPSGRIDVIPRGRDPDQLGTPDRARRLAARRSLGVSDDRPLIIAAARHEHQKGLDVLLAASQFVSAELPDAQICIGGRTGNETDRLSKLLRDLELGERVRFIGPRDDVADLMCAADVWCVPSRWEGLGSILIEAMALEVPVVASDIAAIAEVAGDPPVFELVAVDDPKALASGILRVLRDHVQSAERTKRGRQRFLDRFTSERVSNELLEFYVRALASSRWNKWLSH